MMPLVFRRFATLLVLALLAAFAPHPRPASAATTLHVANTNDTGVGSLRAALLASQNGDTIVFDNNGALWTIQPATPLPALDKGGVTLDGGPNHTVVLDGSQVTSDPINIVANANGLTISSSGNTIKGLVIVGFFRGPGLGESEGGSGIRIVGASAAAPASGNTIAGCWIGVAADGATAAGNSHYGILLDDHTVNTIIGGTTAGQGNVVAGNGRLISGGANIAMFQALFSVDNPGPISGNKVIGNFIGTTSTGLATIGGGNPRDGIVLGDWAQNTIIGGTTAAERNIIAGHNYSGGAIVGAGINIAPQAIRPGSGNVVAGNYIGTDKDGAAAIPNAIGVLLNGGTNTRIGGPTAASRNLISGNSTSGVVVRNTGTLSTTIANNWIGLNGSGGALGNGAAGVTVETNATNTTIGPGNVISANSGEGVRLSTGGNTVKGNFIGTTQDGSTSNATFSNSQPGVRIDDGANNLIGGTTAADRNVIALSKQLVGVDISGGAAGTQVFGNYLGVNASGSAVFTTSSPDGSADIRIGADSTNSRIGGATAASGNVIGGAYAGIKIEGTTTGNVVKNNAIGVGAGGQNVGNRFYGIWLLGSTNNTVGDVLGAEGNVVANNGVYGIYADGSGASNNTIAGNTVRNNGVNGVQVRIATGVKITQTQTSSNTGNGIGLAINGNANLPAPSGLQFSTVGGAPTLSGTTCAGCVVEVFTSATRDDGEGPRYLTTTTASGTSFSVNVTGCSQFLTATARDGSNNTSTFSTPMVDAGAGCASAEPDVQLDPAILPTKTVLPGATATYTHTMHNSGKAAGTFTNTTSSTQPNWTI
jgi:parallel beta-helix repeat protein